MSFHEVMLGQPRPASVRAVQLPRRANFFPSPQDWRDEVIYFLLPDRFSDGNDAQRPLLNRTNLAGARPPGFRSSRKTDNEYTKSMKTNTKKIMYYALIFCGAYMSVCSSTKGEPPTIFGSIRDKWTALGAGNGFLTAAHHQ
jgi:hypothetical protein